jgi:xanthine dehydrogenase YagS FAD-binding subunit
MNPFAYVRPANSYDALRAIASVPNARYIAGGTNILDLMKDDVERPPLLIDINAIGLRDIAVTDDAITLGALARMADVARHPAVRGRFTAVAMALDETASPQLRNMGTIGGNVLQRTRCAYFRDPATPCNKRRPGSGCAAIGGVNRTHAILGTGDRCIATHASDLAVALVAFDATLRIVSTDGTRDVPIRNFYRLPQDAPNVENLLAPGELIASVTLRHDAATMRSAYLKVRDRAQYEFALASAAVALDVESGTIRDARIALGGVGTIPWLAPEASAILVGAQPSRELFQRAAAAAVAGARGYGQNDFKIVLAQHTLVRALESVAAA